MRRVSTIIALALCTLLCVSISSAQQTSTTATTATTATASVPNLIRYSGTLKDAQGAPVSPGTAVGVTFAIYNQQDGGAPVWQETQNVTPDASGNYSALLGSTTATGLPGDLFSQQEQRWLGVQGQGQEEQARVLLVSVPYALKAQEAETLGGMPASAFVQASPSNASTDTGIAVNALSSAGNANISSKGKGTSASRKNVICAALTANGLANYVPLFDPTVCNLVNSVIYQSAAPASYIGINQPNPSAQLDVNGNISTSLQSQSYQIGYSTVLSAPGGLNLFVGFGAGSRNNTGFLNTFSGVGAGEMNTTGTNNTFSGQSAGYMNVSGTNNTFSGSSAGYSGTTGSFNTYLGAAAGYLGTTSSANTFVGEQAGFSNTAGANSFYGYQTGYNNGAGTNNAFYGYQAGLDSSGSNGSFYGYQAGYLNNANGNTFVGYQSGFVNSSGNSNTFLGNLAGTANTTGSGDTFVGDSAGTANMTGNNNTFTGQNAGKANTVGSANVMVGLNAGLLSADPAGGNSYNTFVGTNTGYNSTAGANTFLGYSAGSSTNTGSGNTAAGYDAGRSNTIGFDNVYYGSNADFNANGANTTGSCNTYLGAAAGSSFAPGPFSRSNNTFVGCGAGQDNGDITGGNDIFIGAGAGTSELDVSNNIEIGSIGPAPEHGSLPCHPGSPCSNQILIGAVGQYGDPGTQIDTYVQGIWGAVPGNAGIVRFVCVDQKGKLWGSDYECDIVVGISSRRFKDQIADMGDSSSKLFQLRPVTFFYKPQYDDGSHSLQYGLIAEEVAGVYPEMVAYDKDGQPYSVKYQLLAPMLLNELQKQHTLVAEQQDVIKGQQEQIEEMQQRLSRLEALVAGK